MCTKCNDTGVVHEYKGMGMWFIGPCMDCNKRQENARRSQQELQQILDMIAEVGNEPKDAVDGSL